MEQPDGVGEGPFTSAPSLKLYNMKADPLEQTNVATTHPELWPR